MPDTVSLREDLRIIEVKSVGETTNEEMLQTRKILTQICQETNISGIIIDARESNSIPSIFAVLDFGANLFRYDSIPRTTRFAIVSPKNKRADCEFYTTVCKKRGLVVEVLDSVGEAEGWLVG